MLVDNDYLPTYISIWKALVRYSRENNFAHEERREEKDDVVKRKHVYSPADEVVSL